MNWKELIAARENSGFNYTSLQQSTGIATATLSKWETDAPAFVEKVKQLCETLDVTPNFLFGWQVDSKDATATSLQEGTTVVNRIAFDVDDVKLLIDTIEGKVKDMKSTLISADHIDIDLARKINKLADKLDKLYGILDGNPGGEDFPRMG
jgi:DNA-binding Xre family transcriptional regulator